MDRAGWVGWVGRREVSRVVIQFVSKRAAGIALCRCEFAMFGRAFEQESCSGLVAATGVAQHDQGSNQNRSGVGGSHGVASMQGGGAGG